MPIVPSRSTLTPESFAKSTLAMRAAAARRSRAMRRRSQALTFVAASLITLLIPLVGCSQEEAAADATHPAKPTVDPAIAAIDAFIAKHPVTRESKGWRTHLAKPPRLSFDPHHTYYWKLDTNVGEIRFRLLTDVAPMHASSTIYLTRLGYYDKLKFHRVISGFMAQGGDPLGNGRGGPGYTYAGEFNPNALHDSAGTLSMANSGPNTDGSQFFITFKPTPALNNRHTVFGKAESDESLKTIRAMEALGRPRDPAPPIEPIFIKKASILIE